MIKKLIRPFVIAMILIVTITNIYIYNINYKALVNSIDTYDDKDYTFICKISDYPVTEEKVVKTYADIISTDFPLDMSKHRILLRLPKDDYDSVQYGYTVELNGKISSPSPALNKGGFDYRRYLQSKNTPAIFDRTEGGKLKCISKNTGITNSIYKTRRKVIYNIQKHYRGDIAALCTAILTGDRSTITDEMSENYKRCGIYHIVAVSGLHAGIFISVITFALFFLPFKNRKKKIVVRIFAVIISILLYIFTGFGISVTRVILMMALLLCANIVKREYNIMIILPTAAILILLSSPYQIFNQSFQLSFLSTYGLCAGLEIFKGKIPKNKLGNWFLTPMVISLGATLATMHIIIYNFHGISIIGVFSNLAAVPLAGALLSSLVAFSFLSVFIPFDIMALLKYIPYIPAKLINILASFTGSLEFSYIRISPFMFMNYSVAIILTASAVYTAFKKKIVIFGIITSIIVVNCALMMYNTLCKDTKITFINAGKGESVLIETGENNHILIDCGSKSSSDPTNEIFIPYFECTGIRKIDKLYISYFDDEHTNSVNFLMKKGYVREIILPEKTEISRNNILFNRNKIIDAAEKFGVKYSYIDFGSTHKIDNTCNIYLRDENKNLKDKNATAIYTIQCGDTSFTLSSCLGAKGQELLADISADCDVIKIPSYGKMTKSTDKYILSNKPEFAVITFPQRDRYEKFDTNIEDFLTNNNIEFARTDKSGTLTFITNGKTIKKIEPGNGVLK